MSNNGMRRIFAIAVLFSILIIGWSVQANHDLNLNSYSADGQGSDDDYGIAPLVTSCNLPYTPSSVLVGTYSLTSYNSLVTADFNKDGNMDFLVPGLGSVSIRLGNGRGGFNQPAVPEIFLGNTVFGVEVGDFNKDGNLDFVATNRNSATVSIRLGDGNGGFTSPATPEVTVSSTPQTIAVGDFNKDGNLDFVTANNATGTNNVSIRLGNGSGGFTSPATPEINLGFRPTSIAVGDFNKDGNLDFVTTNGSTDNVSIRLGNGSGGFTSPATPQITVGDSPQLVLVGDFNKDGNLDFAALNNLTNNVSIRLGNGSGGFTSPTPAEVSVGASPNGLILADLNNDGNLDFATSNGSGNNVSIRFGAGNGTFTSPATPEVASGIGPRSMGTGDLNNDGIPDLLVSSSIFNDHVALRLGDGIGGFNLLDGIEVATPSYTAKVAFGDVNNDGRTDMVGVGGTLAASSCSIRLGTASGGFSSPTPADIPVGLTPQGVALGDFNNDGKLDIAAANTAMGSNNVSIRLGAGNGTFTSPATPEVAVGLQPASIVIADFNNDGKMDFATANGGTGGGNVSIRLGNGTGGFTSPSPAEVTVGGRPKSIAIGDFNNDGKIDFVTANNASGANTVSIRLGAGNGTFTSPATPEITVGTSPVSVGVGDFNSDGRLDFATANEGSSNVSIRLGNGSGGFTSPATPEVTVGLFPEDIAVGDLSGDGILDIAVATFDDADTVVRFGNGDGSFTTPTTPTFPIGGTSVAIKDLNGDGDNDLIATNSGQSYINVVFNSCAVQQKMLLVNAGNNQSAPTNTSFATIIKAQVLNGIPVNAATVTFTAPAFGASGTFAGSTTTTVITNSSGIATTPPFRANGIEGSYRVIAKVTITGTTVYRAFNLTNTAGCPTITLAPTSLNNGSQGNPYSQSFTASGGSGPYTYMVTSGSLPTGLSLSSAGLLSGTPSTSGTFNFGVTARDSNTCTGTSGYALVIAAKVTSQVAVSVASTNYSTVVSPNYVGNFTINTSVRNNGTTLSGPLYFRVTTFAKVGTDLDPTRPNRLISANNGAGIVGDIQTMSAGSIASGSTTPVTFSVGIGSRQAFQFFVDLFNGAASKGVGSQLGHYEFNVSEDGLVKARSNNNLESEFSINALSTNVTADNMELIGGAGVQSRPVTLIDPRNSNRIAVVANDLSSFNVILKTTQDGGASWNSATLPRNLNGTNFFNAQNGALAYDASGRLFIAYTLGNLNDSANALVVTNTLDGSNFAPLKVVTQHAASEKVIDSRPAIAIASTNMVYVAWDSYSTATHTFTIQVANAATADAASTAVVVRSGLVSAPVLALSRSGLVYVGWNEWGFNSQAPLYNTGGRVMVAVSRNNGRSFITPTQIGLTNIGFAGSSSAMPETGATPNLTLIADTKTDNTLFAAYTTKGRGLEVVFTSSINNGGSWKAGKVVNNDGLETADQFNPTLAINSADGSLRVAFYDTRLNVDGSADVFLASSKDGGISFTNNRITTIASNDSRSNVLRDYSANLGEKIGMTVQDGIVVLVWTDTRQGSEDIFIQISR